ncbi:non-ribosomal peptide synthetase [Verminephrobacter eiseniae]|uniref:non-ribosomal peptide synthetase n=1 Tax=Verminephrobacter eiseniae TaxID=364317 RepID=UPI0022379A4F|nr:non-ribosomal peptide synthetase [Verminephrobacter eiseniae]
MKTIASSTRTSSVALDREALRQQIAALLPHADRPPLDTDNLLEHGLDSLQIMRLVGLWRRSGADVSFAQLVEHPTFDHWFEILSRVPDREPSVPPTGVTTEDHEPFALSDVQHAYWIGRRDDQPLGGVGCHAYIELDGRGVDPDRLGIAWRLVLKHHPMLRAVFDENGQQHIPRSVPDFVLPVHDLGAQTSEQVQLALLATRQRLDHRRLDVAKGEVAGLELSLLPGGATRIHFDIDLLVADVQSLHVLLRDLAAAYARKVPPPSPPDWRFARYLEGQRANRARSLEKDRGYWQSRMESFPTDALLPLAARPEPMQRPVFTRRSHSLPLATWERLRLTGAAHRLTPAMVLASAFSAVLARWGTDADVLLNVPLFDREVSQPGLDNVVADFTNLLLLRADHRGNRSFAEQARALQQQFHADVAHAGYSGVQVQRDLASRRQTMGSAAPVVFACNLGTPLVNAECAAVLGKMGHMISQTPGVWLDHQIYEYDDGLLLCWDVVEALFPAGTMDALFAAYGALQEWLAGDEARWNASLPDLLPADQVAVRLKVNATAAPLPQGLLHEGFFDQAASSPERVALLGDGAPLSYAALAHRALRIAALLQAEGVVAGDPVAVTLPRGADQIAAVLGVLAAGAVYVPVNLEQPDARRTRIHRTAGIRHVLGGPASTIDIRRASHHRPLPGPLSRAAHEAAYVIFTSGSTGEPKGVEVSHAAALNTVADINRRFGVGPEDRVLTVSALDFDLSVYDIFGLLGIGGALVLVGEADRREAVRWHDLIGAHGVTLWNSAPALLEMLLAAPGGLPSLRLALASGDWIGLDLPTRLRERAPACRFISLGGATEAAIWSNAYEVDEVAPQWRSIPYGFPLANQRYRVVNAQGRDCPDWVAGELWIGGAGVALGYRGDPETTAARFLTQDGTRWYRTGDLGRYWPDGTLEFLGRADQQVKVRGHRIELGEIEAAMEAHPSVAQAVAVAVGERGRQRLAGFITATGPNLDPTTLAPHLTALLPAHAVPPTIVVLDTMPLTPNGKIDRKALSARATQAPDAPHEHGNDAPSGPVETTIAAIWAELLGLDTVGRHDSFLALGGDSLIATRVITRLHKAGIEGADLSALFAHPTLREFAQSLSIGALKPSATLSPDHANRQAAFPLTEVQQAYWMGRGTDFDLGGVSCHFYTEFEGNGIDLSRLEEAWNRLITRHEMLRAVFDASGQQRILPEVPRLRIPVTDAPTGQQEHALQALRAAMSEQVIALTRWPLFDVRAVRFGRRVRIGVSIDNIIIDALSTLTLFTEVETLYADLDAPLRPVDVSFRDYVLQVKSPEATLDADRAYWREQTGKLPPGPQLPLACHPSSIGKPHFVRREALVATDRYEVLRQRARRHGLTASSVLATAFAEAIGAWSAREDFTINLTLFDRREVHPDINNILGDFTSLMLLPHRPQPGDSWLQRAARLQRQSVEDLGHSSVSAVWVMRELARQNGTMDAGMPIIFTSTIGLLGALPPPPARPVLKKHWGISQTPQVWLDCQIVECDEGLSITWDVVEALFPAGTMDALFAAYGALQEWLAGDEARWNASLPDLLPADQAAVRLKVNATAAPLPQGLLHEGFFDQAASSPERVALLGDGAPLSYAALAHRALRIAALLQAEGVVAGDPVAVTLPRGADQIAAVLGVLAAGAVYVPVNLEQPDARRTRIHRTAGIRHVLGGPASTIDIRRASHHRPLPGPLSRAAHEAAYVIFTSGSTGEPKGVEVSHAAALNTVADINRRFGVGPEDRVLTVSALDFDLSVYDIFGLLGIGGALVLVGEADRREAVRWHDLIGAHGVTLWNSAPALLEMLLAAPGGLPSLRLALASGDWIGLDLPTRLRERAPACRFISLGGATEAAIWSNAYEVDEVAPQWRSIPYGFPLANQRYRVVNAQGRDCPDWVAGELWIGGAGVALGYRGDPETTAARFLTQDGTRWYRTGDLGRYWPDGTLEFLGRADQQVKVRGHRIELGEIEAAMEAHPSVAQAVAVAVGERGRQRLAGFITATGPNLDPTTLAPHLTALLPAHAVPPTIVVLDTMPLTPNGKIDRKALSARATQAPDVPHEHGNDAPSGPVETTIAAIWAELLGLDTVGRHDSFLAFGGDSLIATEMVARVGRELGLALSLRQIFSEPTIAGLVGVIEARTANPSTELLEEGVL